MAVTAAVPSVASAGPMAGSETTMSDLQIHSLSEDHVGLTFDTQHGVSTASTRAALLHWLATTVNWIRGPINPLALPSKDSPDASITVVWCLTHTGNDCVNPCGAYSGAGNVCIIQPGGVGCIASTSDEVTYCTSSGCGQSCPRLGDCPVPLDHGFCLTPNVKSILVPLVT
ncbi:hypothetical protein BV20DRAFT_1049546 [Pilatotrama ljubarskyi]|nr:hypothetical protein BV20DRAFT_1049546 [Pilatotrama ljubarskyi]